MQLTESHIVKDKNLKEWCIKAKLLYNQTLYYWRQSIFGNIQYFNEYEIVKLFQEYNEPKFRALPANTSQQIIYALFKNVKSWQKARKDYAINPNKYKGRPRLPNYKKELSELYFSSNQVKLKEGYIHFPKMMNIKPIKTRVPNIDCCRIIPKANHFVIEFIYIVQEEPLKECNGNWIGIDIGLNNLATCTSNVTNAFIINGKPLKAINHHYNRKLAWFQSIQKKENKTEKHSKRMNHFTYRRNNKVKDYLYKASRIVINKAIENNITKIIIGKNKQWKQEINLGTNTNQKFVSIPHAIFIEQVKYKAKLVGIDVILTQEAYTSKCSAFDNEPIGKHETYLGKRKKRGLFVTSKGELVNSDANGSLNIARIVSDDVIIDQSVKRFVVNPYRINLDKNFVHYCI